MKSKSDYEKQREQAREWAIKYIVDCLDIEPTEENVREYARARRRVLKQFHHLRGPMVG